jgi:glycosyltransferase involved in cell wall biosynthesis
LAERRYRVLAVCSHPVQYTAPLFRKMVLEPRLDLSVAYCSLRGVEASHDPEFGTTVKWDVPLLDGYKWAQVPNRGKGGESFWGLNNPGLARLIHEGKFDAIFCFLTYLCASFWISYFAARRSGSPFIFGGDAWSLLPRSGGSWKIWAKKLLWPRLFSLAAQVIVPSTASRDMMLSLGIPAERISTTPYCVDNDWWKSQSQKVDRNTVRASWGAGPETCIILFCAKLQPWKRPMDLLRAFAQAKVPNGLLIFAGEGAQRTELEQEATALGIGTRVRFLGFVNQSKLPEVYTAADLMVLPSEYEPFAVVVNEASCCGCAVAASDRVGATRDLVAPVDVRLIFPYGDVAALSALLTRLCGEPDELRRLGRTAQSRMDTWSFRQTTAGMIEAIECGLARTGPKNEDLRQVERVRVK